MILKTINGNTKNFIPSLSKNLAKRKNLQFKKNSEVIKMINNIKKNGIKAVIYYEKKFNKVKNLNHNNLKFTKKEIIRIASRLDQKTKRSIDLAFIRIKKFHSKQKFISFKYFDKYQNKIMYKYSPINTVGVYVPGGTASYPSTVLMNCIPAIIAGVKNIIMTTPCLNSKPNPAIIYAAKKCGVKEIYKIGGAHAIGALAYGASIIKKVDKIVGPGNAFVAAAKKIVFGDVGIDMVAGPSEVTIICDKNSNPDWVAADLIAQAEHDIYAQSIIISDNKKLLQKVKLSLYNQLNYLPKKKIASSSLKNFGMFIFSKNKNNTANIINEIAPEHLELNINKPETILSKINNAGSIFIGKYSPEAMGDYLAGPNHVLPTSGSAKFSSGLSVSDFLKRHSLIKISKRGIERLGPSVINLAKYENLEGHANSIKLRLEEK